MEFLLALFYLACVSAVASAACQAIPGGRYRVCHCDHQRLGECYAMKDGLCITNSLIQPCPQKEVILEGHPKENPKAGSKRRLGCSGLDQNFTLTALNLATVANFHPAMTLRGKMMGNFLVAIIARMLGFIDVGLVYVISNFPPGQR
ncbi:hypothetical protein E2P81_ATG02248 [Venturia nashicola]|uniref:Uncharacterized protein n=1 Tax=Venturia nashicola TaxID=86259 RepID=A0A4Z1PDP5_9PEZI|nr:hypothetical protein E6O75_ATG02305 [Venturia nashicola]TLD35945.1 hypothetical protein E2P81_ATG02248 [Venturia nashicola]